MEKKKDIRYELCKEVLTLSLAEQEKALEWIRRNVHFSHIDKDCLNCSAGGMSTNSTVLS